MDPQREVSFEMRLYFNEQEAFRSVVGDIYFIYFVALFISAKFQLELTFQNRISEDVFEKTAVSPPVSSRFEANF